MVGGESSTSSRPMPVKQKMAVSLKSLLQSARKLALGDDPPPGEGEARHASTPEALFAPTTAAADGPECEHDCEGCPVSYPRNFKIEESDLLYGHVKGWATHAIVATGKSDWVRDVADEKGSVMQAVDRAAKPSNGVSNFPFFIVLGEDTVSRWGREEVESSDQRRCGFADWSRRGSCSRRQTYPPRTTRATTRSRQPCSSSRLSPSSRT